MAMKLKDFTKKPLAEALEDLELTDYKVHTDNDGNVCSVELKYVDKEVSHAQALATPTKRNSGGFR